MIHPFADTMIVDAGLYAGSDARNRAAGEMYLMPAREDQEPMFLLHNQTSAPGQRVAGADGLAHGDQVTFMYGASEFLVGRYFTYWHKIEPAEMEKDRLAVSIGKEHYYVS